MPDKNLAESSWKSFAKGKGYKDPALLKALAALDKADKAGPAAQLDALADIEKQSDLLLKAHKGDKELASQLDTMGKAVARERKAAEQAAADDSEPETPVLLTTRMAPLLRQVRQGDVMQVLIATTGKDTAVLLSRRGIAPTRRKLLTDYMGASGGVKFITGECLFEENAHTFVVQSQAGGLAKKLKAALLAQTDMRMKVRVRGDDPNDIDEEGEEADAGNGAAAAAPAATPAATPAVAPAASPQLAAAYQAKLAQLQPRVQQALAAKAADAAKYQTLLDFAAGKAREDGYAAAAQALLSLEKLMAAAPPAAAAIAAAAPSAAPTADGAAAFNARLAALMPRVKDAIATGGAGAQAVRAKVSEAGTTARDKNFAAAQALLDDAESLLAGAAAPAAPPALDEAAFRRDWQSAKAVWDDALDTVNGQIGKLQTALRALNDPDLTEIADGGLAGVTGNFKAPMVAAMMDIDSAHGQALAKAARKASKIAGAFQNYLNTEETVRVTDDNEFGVPVTLRASLGSALRNIESTLKALA